MSPDQPRRAVLEYFEQVNDHDVEGALDRLSEEFELEFVGGPTLDKADVARAMGWDAGTNGRIAWRIVSFDESEVEVEGEETNDFLRLLGIPPLRFRSRFLVDEDGLIARQEYEAAASEVSVEEALVPVVAWAERHAPEELEKAYPGGRLVYSEEHGRRWVDLLHRCKAHNPEPSGE